jgi:hypothetical protein
MPQFLYSGQKNGVFTFQDCEKENKEMKRSVKRMICMLLIAVMVMGFAGCGAPAEDEIELITVSDGEIIGEGETEFPLTITDADGVSIQITVKTDETTVGGALVKLGLIAGDNTEYGLYMKTVNGMTLDYDIDKMYWGFYIDGMYAMTGVDMTDIVPGAAYELKADK